jgi:hypothetical protein
MKKMSVFMLLLIVGSGNIVGEPSKTEEFITKLNNNPKAQEAYQFWLTSIEKLESNPNTANVENLSLSIGKGVSVQLSVARREIGGKVAAHFTIIDAQGSAREDYLTKTQETASPPVDKNAMPDDFRSKLSKYP